MSARRPLLFELPPRRRRFMMHVIDAGNAEGGKHLARFRCKRCGAETDWYTVDSITEAKRGTPCAACNRAK